MKTGDKVKIKEKFWEIESDIFTYSGMKKLAGRTLEVRSVYNSGIVRTKQDDSNDNTSWYWDKNWVELYRPTITWDTLKWKDVMTDEDGDEYMVLGILNDMVLLSDYNDFEVSGGWFHKQKLQKWNYTIKQAIAPTPETESEAFKKMVAEVKRVSEEQVEKAREAETIVEKLELTLDQIAEKFGVDVTNIKIKK